MKAPTEWQSNINGQIYNFSHSIVLGKHNLTINGVSNTIKGSFFSSILGFDEPINFDGIEARLVVERKKPDIVVNGVYLQSQKPYIPRPKWSIVFVILCILIPIISLGGALPAVIGVVGALACVQISKTSLPVAARIALCILITAAAWVLWFVLIFAVAMAQL